MNHGRCPTQTDSSNSSHGCECHCALTLRLLIERPTQILTTLPRELPLLQPSRLLTYLLIEHDLFSIGYGQLPTALWRAVALITSRHHLQRAGHHYIMHISRTDQNPTANARTTIRFSYILQKSSACQSCVKRGIAYFKV